MVNEAPDGDDIEVELKVYRGASWKDIGTVTITDAEIKQIRDEFKDQVPQENNRGPQRLGDLLSSLTKIEKGEVG